VAVRQSLGEPLGREPLTVVLDDQDQLAAVLEQIDAHARRPGVSDDVRQELARRREDELFLRVTLAVPEVEVQLELGTCRRLNGNGADGRFEPRFVEDVRMEIEDRLAELMHGQRERVVGSAERRMTRRGALSDLLELVAGGEQVLGRPAVQRLGGRFSRAPPRLAPRPRQAAAPPRQGLPRPPLKICSVVPVTPGPPQADGPGMKKATPDQIKAAFTRLDANKDGKLSLQEYLPPS